MIARLQQLIAFSLLAAAIAVWYWLRHLGHPWLGVLAAMSILCGHAAVLAVEFVLMQQVNRRAPNPAPTPNLGQLSAAWLSEAWHAPLVFCWRQPFRSGHYPDHLPNRPDGPPQRGVLLVHGFVCNRGIWNPWLRRLQAQGRAFVAVNLAPPFAAIDAHVATLEAAIRRLEAATGCAPVVVAHSMGGLALRRWWIEPGNAMRLAHVITIGTPHHGTWLARFATTRNARQMQTGHPWLSGLLSAHPGAFEALSTCFYSNTDNIVFPASHASLPGADNRLLAGVPHVAMVDDPRPWDELQRHLRA